MPRQGVLLVNVGSPDDPSTGAVRRYLRQFLMDGRVIDIPAWQRFLLVNLIIAPLRAPRSAHAYQKVWTDRGSPLVVHARDLAEALRLRLGPEVRVAIGMAVGNPSIQAGLEGLIGEGCDRVLVVPLFPHDASATWGGAAELAMRAAGERWEVPAISVLPPFWDDPRWEEAVAAVAAPALTDFAPDHVLFSNHGLPVRQLRRGCAGDACDDARRDCGDFASRGASRCYKAQCDASTARLANRLGLEKWSAAFQSRLGRDRWLEPATASEVERLAGAGVRRLAVICPSFAADCLETLEEIGLACAESFRAAGGEELRLIPCVNAEAPWADALAAMIHDALPKRLIQQGAA